MDDRSVRARNPSLLLDAWLEAYSFNRHEVVRGRMPVRSGPTHLGDLSRGLRSLGAEHSVTGLAAAWLHTRFAEFRLVTVFLSKRMSSRNLSEIGFVETQSGANTWLVLPADDSVFWQSATKEGIPVVHPVQAYLDLKDHPERASEAAEELRRTVLDLSLE
ncbi:MAG: type IV toxin-antitoxin system AbiEi family antitoxin [Acidobacteriota bacterium]